MEQPQANPEHVINILRVRLNEEIYQRALLEAAYTQQTQQINQLRQQAANQHTKLSQELENQKPETWNPKIPPSPHPLQTDTTTTNQPATPETDATPANTSQTPKDTR